VDVGIVALAVGALLAAGIGASLLAGRLRLPGLVLVLVLGMVIGSDGLGWINFGDYDAAQSAAIMALALILYEGGLSSGWAEIRPVIGVSIALATIGTLITAGITAIVAGLLFGELSWLEALIMGGAGSPARSKASRASTTRWPSCSCWPASRRSRSPTSDSRTRSGWPGASSRSARLSGLPSAGSA
jgi:hypothetical protein